MKHCKEEKYMEVFMCQPLINIFTTPTPTHSVLTEQGYSFHSVNCIVCKNEAGWHVYHDAIHANMVATYFMSCSEVEAVEIDA